MKGLKVMNSINENAAAGAEAKEQNGAPSAVPMTVEARVRPIAPKENLLGFANVTINGCLVIEGLRIRQGKNGINVGMPGAYDGDGKWRDTCKPITAEFQKQIADTVRSEYAAAIDRMAETVAATKDAAQGIGHEAAGGAEDAPAKTSAVPSREAETGAPKAETRGPAKDKPASSLADTLKKNTEKAKAHPAKAADAKAAQTL
jgi:stage V sporulation protein G